MTEEDDFCPILKRVQEDTMQLARQMAEIESRASGERANPSIAAAADSREEVDMTALLIREGFRRQRLDDLFDLTKGRFPCERK